MINRLRDLMVDDSVVLVQRARDVSEGASPQQLTQTKAPAKWEP